MGVTIKVTDEAGVNYDIQWEDHHTLLETLQANGVPVLATCGGNASCATCHGFIDPEHFEAPVSAPKLSRTCSTWSMTSPTSTPACAARSSTPPVWTEQKSKCRRRCNHVLNRLRYSHQPPSSAAC